MIRLDMRLTVVLYRRVIVFDDRDLVHRSNVNIDYSLHFSGS